MRSEVTWKGKREGVFSLAELSLGRIKPPPPLFDGVMLDKTLTMIASPPYVGKSLLLATMATSLDAHIPLFGKYAPATDKRVVVIAQDAPTWDYAGQFTKIVRGMGLSREQRELLDTTLVINRFVQVTDRDFPDAIKVLQDQTGFNVLLIDAFWTIHNMNENDNTQMAMVMETLKSVREDLNCAVVFAHHVRKPVANSGPVDPNHSHRGSSNITAAIDFNIALSRTGGRVIARFGKARGLEDAPEQVSYVVKDVDNDEGPAIKLVAADTLEGLPPRPAALIALLPEPTKKAELIKHYVKTYDMLANKADRAVESDLKLLRLLKLVNNPTHGMWVKA